MEYEGSSKDQNVALKYLFLKVFGNPEQDYWHEMKLIPAISYLLKIPQSSHTSVKKRLLAILEERGTFTGNISKGGGRPPLIVDGTAQADVVYRALGASLSAKDTVCLLNFYREWMDPPLDPISRSAMQGFIERSPAIKTRRRTR